MSALTLPLTVDGTPSVAGKADGVAGSRVAAGDGPNTTMEPGAPLRTDAARNVAQIRAAAIAAFRGLDTPLKEIAAAAGVSGRRADLRMASRCCTAKRRG